MKKRIVLYLLMAFISLLSSGCNKQFVKELEFNERNGFDDNNLVYSSVSSYTDQITKQWLDSGHASPTEATIGRDGCILCHDGGAYTVQTAEVADLDKVTGQDCLTCHSGFGSSIKDKGLVDIPVKENVIGGAGALCMSCHNSKVSPHITDENRTAPHYSSQADVLTGFGGIRKDEEIQYNNTFGHISLTNSCVDCHMPMLEDGFLDHTFKMKEEFAQLACGKCHYDVTDFNVPAKADYDGNGIIEGIQDETLGLMNLLYDSIVEELGGGYFETSKGSFVFYDSHGRAMDQISDEIYLATFNYYLIKNDGSKGIHNPLFTVHLLQESYKALTGKEVAGATILQVSEIGGNTHENTRNS